MDHAGIIIVRDFRCWSNLYVRTEALAQKVFDNEFLYNNARKIKKISFKPAPGMNVIRTNFILFL